MIIQGTGTTGLSSGALAKATGVSLDTSERYRIPDRNPAVPRFATKQHHALPQNRVTIYKIAG